MRHCRRWRTGGAAVREDEAEKTSVALHFRVRICRKCGDRGKIRVNHPLNARQTKSFKLHNNTLLKRLRASSTSGLLRGGQSGHGASRSSSCTTEPVGGFINVVPELRWRVADAD